MPRYLTKSRFKLALECTAKLYYTGKKEYVDNKLDDSFLASLAEGGFQVGELAKIYYEGGHNIEDLDHSVALEKTNDLLRQDEVVIYEAAFSYKDLFVRADLVRKHGKYLELIEVKAKSYDPGGDGFLNSKGGIRPNWEPYLFDVAFQYYVITKAFPDYKVVPYLMLADKSARSSIEGLNQCFHLEKSGSRTKAVTVLGLTKANVGDQILTKVDVSGIVLSILNNEHSAVPFEHLVDSFAHHYATDTFLLQPLGKRCATCEFKASHEEMSKGFRSGFHECWQNQAGFKPNDFDRPSILSVWFFNKKEEYIKNKKYFQDQMTEIDFESKAGTKKNAPPVIGLSRSARQALQVEKSRKADSSFYLDVPALKAQMAACAFPLHFIDFETTAVALPFNKGRRPYEQIAFQFSHHTIEENGTITHAGQWINTETGKFPNFEFVRALKKELEKDKGSIFRYAAHENSILNAIYEQLQLSGETDKDVLCDFIKTITHSTSSSAEKWQGERDMIDMFGWVLRFYYSPLTNGSNSIKRVLPAMLADSQFLRNKYDKPTYGTEIKSLNFKEHTWITFDEDGKLINPYYTLPRIHDGIDNESMDTLMTDEEAGIFDGGAAMTAYARMQFTQMQQDERLRVKDALLRYCELDTMAMVMIWEGWNEWCK